jgi:hypothetical protein
MVEKFFLAIAITFSLNLSFFLSESKTVSTSPETSVLLSNSNLSKEVLGTRY